MRIFNTFAYTGIEPINLSMYELVHGKSMGASKLDELSCKNMRTFSYNLYSTPRNLERIAGFGVLSPSVALLLTVDTSSVNWFPELLTVMYDQQRASPQPRSQYRPNAGTPPVSYAGDDGSLQSTQPVSNVRFTSRPTGLNRSSTMTNPHDWNKPQNTEGIPPHPASDQGHTRPNDHTHANAQIYGQFSGSSSGPSSSHGGSSPYPEENSRSPVLTASTLVNTSSSALSHGSSSSASTATSMQPCSACGLPMSGQFVRALGSVYHLDCFRCRVCVTYHFTFTFQSHTFLGLQQRRCSKILSH